MTWQTRYQPLNDLSTSAWHGRDDTPPSSCFFQRIQPLNLNETIISMGQQPLTFAILGFCCDEGIRRNHGRTGAAAGPAIIRETLARMPIQKNDIICFDAGDIVCTDDDLEAAQNALGQAVAILLEHKITPIVIGGGHEVAFGHYQGIAPTQADQQLGIVNFDAHFDMRPLLPHRHGSSGTPFLQIANAHKAAKRRFDYNCVGIQHAGNIHQLFETAKHWHTNTILADDFHQGYMDKCVNFIDRVIDQSDLIYTSICLDVFASPYAPGVSAPQPLGLMPWQVIPLLRQLAASSKVLTYDIAEMSPQYDQDHRTAKLAATIVYEIIHHHQPLTSSHYGNHA